MARPKDKGKQDTLFPLQVALLNSLFGGRTKAQHDSVLADFQIQVKANWSKRAVPDAIQQFLEEHAPNGTAIPKPKDARCELFWKLLSELD